MMRIQHGRLWLELHELKHGDGPALLLLHALFGSSADWGEAAATWPGAVYGLDFSGHGRSSWLKGGGYYAELLLGDADAALARIGTAAVAGAGLGAYVALLLAGARREQVPAALLLAGAGLDGSGAVPEFHRSFPTDFLDADRAAATSHDPLVRMVEVSVRPVDYAEPFAKAARHLVLLEDGAPRPPWWDAARKSPSAMALEAEFGVALDRLATLALSHRPN